MHRIIDLVKNKNILFITTADINYIRNIQEIKLLHEKSKKLTIIGLKSQSYFLRLVYVFAKIILIKKTDFPIIFIGFAPQLVLPLFNILFKNKIIIIDFFISFYDTIVFDRRWISQNIFLAKIIKNIDRFTLGRADYIISDTKEDSRYFVEELGALPEKIITLYLAADSKIYHPHFVERDSALKGKFIVLYFGSILPLQGVEVILEASDLLKKEDNILFIVIGPIKNKLKKTYHKNNNIIFINWVTQEKLSDYIAIADLCLAGHFNNTIGKAKRVIPGKAFIYKALNKPMILGDNPANQELFIEDGEKIFFIPMGNSLALAEKIRKVYCFVIKGKNNE